MNRIITVSREFGSGGRELGRRLAETLGIEYYDKEIVTEISRHTSLSENYVRQIVDREPHNLFPITIGRSIFYVEDQNIQQAQSIYLAQREIIHSLAEKSDCVIVGRCADFILKDMKPTRLFVYADLESRIQRCMERSDEQENFTRKEMKQRVQNVDKNRAKYYEYYTGNKWGDITNYDLCINSSDMNIKEAVPTFAKLFE